MIELNEWMVNEYGYSWYEHENNLMRLGYGRLEIVEELLGLTYVHAVLTAKEGE